MDPSLCSVKVCILSFLKFWNVPVPFLNLRRNQLSFSVNKKPTSTSFLKFKIEISHFQDFKRMTPSSFMLQNKFFYLNFKLELLIIKIIKWNVSFLKFLKECPPSHFSEVLNDLTFQVRQEPPQFPNFRVTPNFLNFYISS